MQRRSFIGAMVATAAGLLVPARLLEDDPKRVYSFARPPLSRAEMAARLAAGLTPSATLRVYMGQPPASEDVLVSDQLMLSELEFTGSGFLGKFANQSGTASWARYTDRDGNTLDLPVVDAGTHGGGLKMNTRTITMGAIVSCSSLTITRRA